jgi:aspartyl-tRNA synthetase
MDRSLHAQAERLRSEFVIQIEGTVRKRPQGTENPKMPTGEIEVVAEKLVTLSESPTPPFEMLDESEISEETRLKYRYLDLRRKPVLRNMETRYRISKIVRDYLDRHDFLEVETPYLTKSTPEGARDFLVPSRLVPGTFYALPQSPQIFKQILMVAGIDRYFQLARCFRDEDLRADRQPEHTQIDIEMSFVSEEDIFALIEGLVADVLKAVGKPAVGLPFMRLSYEEAMNRYGSDKPDLRFEIELTDVTGVFRNTGLKVFRTGIDKGYVVKGFRVTAKSFSRKELDEWVESAKRAGAKGLVWIKVVSAAEGRLESPVAGFLSAEENRGLVAAFGARDGDFLFLVSDEWETACLVLGELRRQFAAALGLVSKDRFRFLWVVDFPLLEWSAEEKRWQARHHPFTSPQAQDLEWLEKDPKRVKARAYDLVMNGTEIGGGSIRIHDSSVQKRLFALLGMGEEQAQSQFGFLLKALQFGAPPHGGIAVGLDRLTAMLLGHDSIREVIAFPKTQKGTCPMSEAPSGVSEKQLRELGLHIKAK